MSQNPNLPLMQFTYRVTIIGFKNTLPTEMTEQAQDAQIEAQATHQTQIESVAPSVNEVPIVVSEPASTPSPTPLPVEAPKPPELEIATPIEFVEGAPVYWVIFAPNGNLRMFTANKEKARSSSIEWGLPVHPFCQVKKQ